MRSSIARRLAALEAQIQPEACPFYVHTVVRELGLEALKKSKKIALKEREFLEEFLTKSNDLTATLADISSGGLTFLKNLLISRRDRLRSDNTQSS